NSCTERVDGLLGAPVCPGGAVRVVTTIPVEELRNGCPPVADVGAAEPEIPILESGSISGVVATNRGMYLGPDQASRVDTIRLEKSGAIVETTAPQVLLGAEPDGIPRRKGTFGSGSEKPPEF